MAECSLSMGRSRSRRAFASPSRAARTRWPPVTSASLLASATRRPEARAARTAGRAVIPVVATTTSSTPSAVASSSRPPSAHRPGARPSGSPAGLQTRAAANSRRPARRTRGSRWPAARARTSYRSGAARTTSIVWRPMDPVLPRMAIPVMARGASRRRAARRPAGPARRRGASRSDRASRRGPGTGCPSPSGRPTRLSIDLARSPNWAMAAVTSPSTQTDERAHVEQQPAEEGRDERGGDRSPDVALDRLARDSPAGGAFGDRWRDR